jgi:hypothetical protein
VSSKEGTRKEGTNPKKKISVSFGPKFFSAVGGRTVFVQSVRFRAVRTTVRIWHGNRGISGMVFEADFRILVAVSGPYRTVCTTDCGHKK